MQALPWAGAQALKARWLRVNTGDDVEYESIVMSRKNTSDGGGALSMGFSMSAERSWCRWNRGWRSCAGKAEARVTGGFVEQR